MRKNNWIVYIILIVISAFLLWLWYWLGFDHVDAPLDLVLSIIWWLLVLLACWRIRSVEQKRRKRVRTCYLRDALLYNSEAGAVDLASFDAETAFVGLYDVLAGLEYGFDIQDRPVDGDGKELPFDYVVRSEEFEPAKNDSDAADGHAGDFREQGTWRGEVALPSRPNADPLAFETPAELRALLAELFARR